MPARTTALALVLIGAGVVSLPGSGSAYSSSAAVGTDSNGNSTIVINGQPCKVITRNGDGSDSGSVSSSVTAGGGQVSGSTTLPNGSSVTVGPGGSASVTTGSGSSSAAGATAESGSNCVILREPGNRK
jgi:hypothetical protein